MEPLGGRAETPQERIQRLIREGRKTREEVERAEAFWYERLRSGVRLPNGDLVQISHADLCHVIVDDRISREPQRIGRALLSAFEMRETEGGRRLVLSSWQEGERERLAALIIDASINLRSLHLIDQRRLERYRRQAGPILWTQ